MSHKSVMFTMLLAYAFLTIVVCLAFPDQGKWDSKINEHNGKVTVVKSLFKDSTICLSIHCEFKSQNSAAQFVTVKWSLHESACWQDSHFIQFESDQSDVSDNITRYLTSKSEKIECNGIPHFLEEHSFDGTTESKPNSNRAENNQKQNTHRVPCGSKLYPILKDGFYILSIEVTDSEAPFVATIHIEMQGKSGFLSAADWPLLPFYGAMCLVYVVLGLAWLIVSFLQWRDLLRIQFWIGGVILLGMLEMATFYAEYSSINATGDSMQGAVLLAEFVSCGKRTLARMLVIIVSLGFGIVKPRLGPMLHRVVGVGILYFVLAAAEAYMRVMRSKSDPSNQMLVASVPLAVLDSAICWWIFTSLVQTTRTLRLRRNLVKLTLYRHFTNTLIFAVVASVIFMLYSIKVHHLTVCFTEWKELWVDDAYWRLLFSVILLVIMILWRPTNNNQRYAFSPLLDAPEDDDDEEEEQFINDAYGVKMRTQSTGGTSSPKPKNSNSAEDDLKWVEENIPASLADTALPILDSEEEVMTTRFELSKMQ